VHSCSLILRGARRDGCSAAWRWPDNGRMHPCHAGHCTSAAVTDDQRVAFSAACQSPPRRRTEAWQAAIPRLAAELGLAEDALGPVRACAVADGNRRAASRRLSTEQPVLAQIGQERQILRRLHHIAEISKICTHREKEMRKNWTNVIIVLVGHGTRMAFYHCHHCRPTGRDTHVFHLWGIMSSRRAT
jgi:hypothetical protein